jgi:preprotein translocase subunit YajC
MPATFALFLAQATTAASAPAVSPDNAAPGGSGLTSFLFLPVMIALVYFMLIRPQSQAKKKQEELLKTAKTGDRIITSSGIHGVITNVKETTVIVKVADNVKIEIEKTHLDKVNRPDADADKAAPAKA